MTKPVCWPANNNVTSSPAGPALLLVLDSAACLAPVLVDCQPPLCHRRSVMPATSVCRVTAGAGSASLSAACHSESSSLSSRVPFDSRRVSTPSLTR
ncbi:hypothetical protein ACFOLJ_08115 [Rugamonas sp. CCM 8940]|uniref:hypothetical protein n=1 Tax=Rugamonas sp. CCM 8940 TaxID=2765359 RepID=UPI00360AEBB3